MPRPDIYSVRHAYYCLATFTLTMVHHFFHKNSRNTCLNEAWQQAYPRPTTLLVTGRWKDTMVSSGKLSVFLSSPRICLTPNGKLSFQILCIPFDRSSRHRQTQPHMRDSSASSVAHPVAHRCPHCCIPQDPSCSGDSSEPAKIILLWTK